MGAIGSLWCEGGGRETDSSEGRVGARGEEEDEGKLSEDAVEVEEEGEEEEEGGVEEEEEAEEGEVGEEEESVGRSLVSVEG